MRQRNVSAFFLVIGCPLTQYKEYICYVWNVSLICIWGSSWQRWEEVYVLSEDAHQDLWTQCIWHQTEAGVDYRSACIMIWLFDHLSGVLFVNCRESLKMFISPSSFPFFKRHLVHQDTFLYIYNWPLLLCNLLNTFKKKCVTVVWKCLCYSKLVTFRRLTFYSLGVFRETF